MQSPCVGRGYAPVKLKVAHVPKKREAGTKVGKLNKIDLGGYLRVKKAQIRWETENTIAPRARASGLTVSTNPCSPDEPKAGKESCSKSQCSSA